MDSTEISPRLPIDFRYLIANIRSRQQEIRRAALISFILEGDTVSPEREND